MGTAFAVSILVSLAAPPAAEHYVRDLRSEVASVREQAAVSLGRIGATSAVPALIDALKDAEKGVRREAAKALGLTRDARAVAPLVRALADGDMNVRTYAAYALGEIKDPKAAGALLAALGDPAWCVRDQAAWALREIRDPTIAEPLVAALERKEADVAHIVWVLRHVGATHAVGPLAALLKEPDATVRLRAVRALGQFQDAAAADALIAALKDGNATVRRDAVEAVARLENDRAEVALKELAASETDPSVREAVKKAVLALSRRGGLAAHWSFDDRNTTIAKDVTGGGTDGEIKGCSPAEGKVGHALRFGKGKYIEFGRPTSLSIASTPLTVMAWAKSDAPNGVVIAWGGAACGFSLYVKDGVAKFGIRRSGESPAIIAAGREQVIGPWVHLAGVVKIDRIELYVNGKLAATTKTKGFIPGNCGQGLEIGFDVANSPAEITDHFEGIIDEVKVYHAALSEKELAKQVRID